MGHGVELVLPELDFRVDAHKPQMAPVILAGPDRVEFLVIELTQALPPVLILPYPVLESLLDLLLLGLGDGGLFLIQDRLFVAVFVLNIVEYPHIFEI